MTAIELHEHQKHDVEQLRDALSIFGSALYEKPLGGGKTIVGLSLAKMAHRRTLWIVPKLVLVRQGLQEMERMDIRGAALSSLPGVKLNDGGDLGAGRILHEWPEGVDVLIGTYQTAYRRHFVDRKRHRPTFVVVDEAHHSAMPDELNGHVNEAAEIAQRYLSRDATLLGMTATPMRMEPNWGFDRLYSKLYRGSFYEDLEKLGHVVPMTFGYDTAEAIKGGALTPSGEFTTDDIMAINSNELLYENPLAVVKEFDEYQDSLILIFAIGQRHAVELANLLDQFTDRRVALSLSDSKWLAKAREGIITNEDGKDDVDTAVRAARFGDANVLITVNKVTEGVDLPNTRVVIFCPPTNSEVRFIQAVGRGSRAHEESGKDGVIIIDLGGNVARHGKPNELKVERTLLSANRAEAERMRKYDLEKEAAEMEEEIERLQKENGALRAAKEEAANAQRAAQRDPNELSDSPEGDLMDFAPLLEAFVGELECPDCVPTSTYVCKSCGRDQAGALRKKQVSNIQAIVKELEDNAVKTTNRTNVESWRSDYEGHEVKWGVHERAGWYRAKPPYQPSAAELDENGFRPWPSRNPTEVLGALARHINRINAGLLTKQFMAEQQRQRMERDLG